LTHTLGSLVTPDTDVGDYFNFKLVPAFDGILQRLREKGNSIPIDEARRKIYLMNLSPLKDHGDLMLLERLVETSLISGKGLQWRWSKVENRGRKGHVPFPSADSLEPGQVRYAPRSKTSTSVIWNHFVKASDMDFVYLYKPLDPTYLLICSG